MSDLDDFFAKKLEEESNFPNRGKNWKQISQRLDAFDSGMVRGNSPRLRVWQIAAFVAIAVAGLLWWENRGSQRENEALRQELIALQTERSSMEKQLEAVKKSHREVALEETYAPTSAPADAERTSSNEPLKLLERSAKDRSPQYVSPLQTSDDPVKMEQSGVNLTPRAPSPVKEEIVMHTLGKTIVGLEKIEILKNEPIGLDSTISRSTEIAIPKILEDTLTNKVPPNDSQVAVAEASKEIIVPEAVPAAQIKPASPSKNRFRIGGHATVGFVQPKHKGVSALRGQGISVEVKALRSLWVIGSIDWLHHEVSTKGFVPKFHPPHDTFPEPPDGGMGGPPHQPKLVLVEISPRRQQFSLGLRYHFPVKCWLQPSIRMMHDWVRVSPSLVTYKFEDDNPGPLPDPHNHPARYTAEKFKAQWLSNQWKIGLGLEKDIPNWTFSLWADYSKDFSAATPAFDVLYLRAGAQFRF
jgi:hypothetical protein